ncbi:MAG: mRNA surveillance protein pelota [Candidatus Aenigmarchaeota archaeon]|nr:mRNA surveillance protein pelota [Candidatus Aenigmarchaeota archaeon]
MRIQKTYLKEGLVKVMVDAPEDLWHLEKVLEPGDLVTARTSRKTAIKRGYEIGKGERKPVTLTIKVEKISREIHSLRLTGIITSGPEDIQLASYHTLNIEQGTILTIKKEKWKSYQLDRLRRARSRYLLLICAIDRDQADFAGLKDSGLEMKGTIYAKKFVQQKGTGKQDTSELFYIAVMENLERSGREYQHIIIAGPGFERENIYEYIKGKNQGLSGKISTEHANDVGTYGIQEVIKMSANRILKQTRVAKETELVERLLVEIKKEGLAVYGRHKTEEAVNAGAVETLLISDEKIKDCEHLLDIVEKLGGQMMIISAEHESGEKLLHLGGVGAFLRYRI